MCAEAKPRGDFNRDRTKRDGLQSLCRDCQKGNYWRGANRDKQLSRSRAYKAANPEKSHAHRKLEWAVTSGKLTRGFCECCGAEKTDAHHHRGYDRPLDVQWLCRSCHVTLEPRRGAA